LQVKDFIDWCWAKYPYVRQACRKSAKVINIGIG